MEISTDLPIKELKLYVIYNKTKKLFQVEENEFPRYERFHGKEFGYDTKFFTMELDAEFIIKAWKRDSTFLDEIAIVPFSISPLDYLIEM